MRNKKSVLMTGIVNCECSDGEGHGIAHNGQVLPKVGRKSATASPKHKSLIVALMLIVGWSAPLLAIHC